MSKEMVPIRSIKQYIREFCYEGIVKKGLSRGMVHDQILDAFQKEIFGQITFRYKDVTLLSQPSENVDDKTREGVRHIISNSVWKWKKLCAELDKYKETRQMLNPDELMLYIQDVVKIQESNREHPGKTPIEDDAPVEILEEEVAT